ncbi:unnamed protein product [Calypogeia fissa]
MNFSKTDAIGPARCLLYRHNRECLGEEDGEVAPSVTNHSYSNFVNAKGPCLTTSFHFGFEMFLTGW